MIDSSFLKSVNVWITKPQVSNNKIFGSKLMSDDSNKEIISRKIIFKDDTSSILEEIILSSNLITFSSNIGVYEVKYKDDEIVVQINKLDIHPIINQEFLLKDLTYKLNRWLHQQINGKSSLSLIDIENYHTTYTTLKNKYGKDLIKNWEEKTDPEKFVYEDIAIVSYLLCLWSSEQKSDIKFIDVGCGNGLLVYLLVMEGYTGIGVDVRSRKIWSKYPENVKNCLLVHTVDPNSRFPGYTWWIGNHSDELTPWIPVLAAKSSLSQSKVFLLPCCPFDFYGKFNNCSKPFQSRNQSYQEFINITMQKCGFQVKTDYLRIPSTKRFTLVGYSTINDNSFDHSVLPVIEDFVQSRSVNADFIPRKAEILNKNCSTVNHDIRDHICNTVFKKLLSTVNIIIPTTNIEWNKGGRIHINDLSKLFTPEILSKLKNENGGLQTMLKNHHQVFKVVEGFFELRYNAENQNLNLRKRKNDLTSKLKTKNCWYFDNHPDGCPYTTNQCQFIHPE